MYDVVKDFLTLSTIYVRTIKYSIDCCVFAMFAVLSCLVICPFSFVVNTTTRTKTVNFDERFGPKYISNFRNQIYFEWYAFDVNVICILFATCTVVSTNTTDYIVKFQIMLTQSLIFKISNKKRSLV